MSKKRKLEEGEIEKSHSKPHPNDHYFHEFEENTNVILSSVVFSPRKFLFEKKLGQGSFSRAILVTDESTEKPYVLKICSKERIKKTNSKKNPLLNEYLILKYCKSVAGIPREHGYFEDEKYVYLVQDYIRGEDLFEWLNRGNKPEAFEIFCIFYSLYSIMKKLHEKNIIHHDIKAENILICDKQKTITIIDFGLSEMIDPKKPLSTSCGGTIELICPEKIGKSKEDKPAYDGKISDLYALGVVMFCLMFKRFPYSKKEIYDKIKNEDYSLPKLKKKEVVNWAPAMVDFSLGLIQFDIDKRNDFKAVEKHPWFVENVKLYYKTTGESSKHE